MRRDAPARRRPRRAGAFARDTRGAAGIDLAIGAVVLLSVAALCFDLYARIEADTAGARLAITMADYAARGPAEGDTALDGDEMKKLGKFLHTHELGMPADVVYVVSAFRQPAGNPRPEVDVLWSDNSIRFGDPAVTAAMAADCSHHVEDNGKADLPGFSEHMSVGEVLIMAEVCARLTGKGSMIGTVIAGDIYRLHALPLRDPKKHANLAAPAYSAPTQSVSAAFRPTAAPAGVRVSFLGPARGAGADRDGHRPRPARLRALRPAGTA